MKNRNSRMNRYGWQMVVSLLVAFHLSPLTALTSSAQTRIMVVSDIHVMGPGLLVEDGAAWQQKVNCDRKLNDYSRAIFDELMTTALRERPELLLITGDLTKDGELLSHQYVAGELEKLREAGIQTYVIPGNHDMGTAEAVYYEGDVTRQAETVSTDDFAALYEHFGYDAASEREPNTLTYCCEPVDGLVLIGIDTGHDGEPTNGVIPEATLNWVAEHAEAATAAGKRVIVMMHHALIPHVKNGNILSSTYVVKLGKNVDGAWTYHSYSSIRNRLIRAGVRVVLSGHVHTNDIARDFSSDREHSIYDISTGALAAHPCPYRMLTLSEDRQRLDVRTRYVTELSGVDNFSGLARELMEQRLVSLAGEYAFDGEMARMVANLFIAYAEGNEPQSALAKEYGWQFQERQPELRSNLILTMMLGVRDMDWDMTEELVASMLTDTSHYGDASREDVTDDLRLAISMVSEELLGLTPATVSDGSRCYYTLQGIKIQEPSRPGIYISDGRLVIRR